MGKGHSGAKVTFSQFWLTPSHYQTNMWSTCTGSEGNPYAGILRSGEGWLVLSFVLHLIGTAVITSVKYFLAHSLAGESLTLDHRSRFYDPYVQTEGILNHFWKLFPFSDNISLETHAYYLYKISELLLFSFFFSIKKLYYFSSIRTYNIITTFFFF